MRHEQHSHVTGRDKGDTDMSDSSGPNTIGRRQLFKYAGGAAAVAAATSGFGTKWLGKTLTPL